MGRKPIHSTTAFLQMPSSVSRWVISEDLEHLGAWHLNSMRGGTCLLDLLV